MDAAEPGSGALATMVTDGQPGGDRAKPFLVFRPPRPAETLSTTTPTPKTLSPLGPKRHTVTAESALPRRSWSSVLALFANGSRGLRARLVPPLQSIPTFLDTATTGWQLHPPRRQVDEILGSRGPAVPTGAPKIDARVLPSAATRKTTRTPPG